MKKILSLTFILLLSLSSVKAQRVKDPKVVPVEITLSEILRITVTEGGNIEFVINTIDQYNTGISNGKTAGGSDQFYNTHFTIVATATWELDFGAEASALMGTDNFANTMALDNIGYTVGVVGANTCCVAAVNNISATSNAVAIGLAGGTPNGLEQFNFGVFANPLLSNGTGNFGNAAANDFFIHWECGTDIPGGSVPMNTAFLLDQSLAPDRYVTNVFLDVNSL